jgi:signal transduction histidine kinase
MRKNSASLLTGILLLLAYFIAGKLCIKIHEVSQFSAVIWMPSGIASAMLILVNISLWPWILLASFLLNLSFHQPIGTALAVSVGSTLGPWLGAFLLKKYSSRLTFSRTQDVLVFFGASLLLSTFVGSSLEVFSLYLTGMVASEHVLRMWQTWWIGEGMGNLFIAGAAISWWNDIRFRIGTRFRFNFELVGTALLIIFVAIFIFTPLSTYNHSLIVKPYLLFSIIILASLRFDLLGVSFANLTVAFTLMVGVILGFIPFPTYAFEDRMIVAQYFLGVLGTTGFILAAAVREKEEAVDARSEFINVASHELKTPLTSLSLQLQLLERKFNKIDQKTSMQIEELNSFKKANRQANRLIQIVEQILDVSRIERKVMTLHREDTPLLPLLEDLRDRFAEEGRQHQTEIQISVPADLSCNVDSFRLEQALDNLISNAIKYAPGRPIEISAKSHDTGVEFIVQDHGPGIAETKQPYIFDRFVRVSESTHVSGLGLGLFITRQIAEAHGGTISVKSKMGEGTAFQLFIPSLAV